MQFQNSLDFSDLIVAIISLIALGVSVWQALSNKPKLRVEIRKNLVVLGGHGDKDGPFVGFYVTNYGTQPTIISGISILAYETIWKKLHNKSKIAAVVNPGVVNLGDNFPKRLSPGDVCQVLSTQNHDQLEEFFKYPYVEALVYHSWNKNPVKIDFPFKSLEK